MKLNYINENLQIKDDLLHKLVKVPVSYSKTDERPTSENESLITPNGQAFV